MERKLASIQEIKALDPILKADALEKATILGWEVVVKKGEFKPGDLVIYCEVDSVLPEKPEFEFLRKVNFRVKTIKLRGQVSQGICFPLSILPPNLLEQMQKAPKEKLLGINVTKMLGIIKYEVDMPACLRGRVKGSFPSFLRKTDETRIQAEPQVLERHKDKVFYVTEKIDGSSMTVYYRRPPELAQGEFGVCSRNMDLAMEEGNSFWKTALKYDLPKKLEALGRNLALQGEMYGPGVQGNKYAVSNEEGLRYVIFNVYDIDAHQYVSYEEMVSITKQLGLQTVPVLDSSFTLKTTVPEMVDYAKGKSVVNPEIFREGVVLRPVVECGDPDLGRLSFKIINPDFLLKFNE